ncbi:sodium/proline symporter PutP [Actinomyces culturomici]|uniref:sodium/proline symporter PutP n=1 Tax=Actinomyces culturomici TaxID=1926276 RepID=UPI000E205EF5|nr:sodium/proline symporter PutP [Actinomyces culturomici]
MSDHGFQLIAIAIYFAMMLSIGWYAYRRTRSFDGYMLAERGLSPVVAALSANAADMSAWLLMGLPGAIYASGLYESWIAIDLTIGAWLNWKFVAPRLRAYSEIAENSITIPSFLANRHGEGGRPLRIAAALVILVFFTFYVSSGMVAAGKFFEASFGLHYLVGMLIVAAITLVYTAFGGFLGATLTDVAQGLLMLAALICVPVVALVDLGGFGPAADAMRAINPDALNLFAGWHDKGPLLWIIGVISTAAWGLGYFGQPHIIVRFMALRSPREAAVARRISFLWMVATAFGAISTALIAIGCIGRHPEFTLSDPETVFLTMSRIFLHPFVAGFILAAVLAAIMSTMSSQLVVCSSALVEDLLALTGRVWSPQRKLFLGRVGVLIVALVAMMLALDKNNAILGLVAFAWAGFGASFGPLLLLSLYWRRLTSTGAFAGLVSGAVMTYVWGTVDVLSNAMYEIVPGFLLNLVVAVLVSRRTWRPNPEVDAQFDAMEKALSRS